MCCLSKRVLLFLVCNLALLLTVITCFVIMNQQNNWDSIGYDLIVAGKCKPKTRHYRHFPRIVHRVFGFWDSKLPEVWKVSLNSCEEAKNKFKLMIWNKTSSIKFIAKEYPWILEEFLNYRYDVQRADAARYFILHHYGGIYMDMDFKCANESTLSTLYRGYNAKEAQLDSVMLSADPLGITNYFMMTKQCSQFMAHTIARLPEADHWYGVPYLNVMLSTGPMFLSLRLNEYYKKKPRNNETIELLSLETFRESFVHWGKHGTWYRWDATILYSIYENFTPLYCLLLVLFVISIVILIKYFTTIKQMLIKQRDSIFSEKNTPKVFQRPAL